MKHFYFSKHQDLHDLVFQYEVMSQKGKVFKLEETAFLQLADFYAEKESSSKALTIIQQALDQHSFSSDLYLRKARFLLRESKIEEAYYSLSKAENLGTNSKQLYLLKAHALSLGKCYADALEILADLKVNYYVTNLEMSEIYFREAWIYEKQELFDRMFFTLKAALIENPNNLEALERIWVAVELSRNHQESIEFHNYILDIDPYSYQAWYNLGHAYYSLNQYKEAINAFEFAFVINEKFEAAYKDYAEVCFELQYFDKALKCYLEILDLFEVDPEILIKTGECYEYLGNTAKAKIFFFRALNLDPRNDEIYFHIGECYSKEKHWESATHFYKQALKLEESREDYLYGLATVYQHLNRPKKALPLYFQAIEIAPEQTDYWLDYAKYKFKLGDINGARGVLEEAELNTYGAKIYYCKAAVLFSINQKTAAIDAMREGFQEDFDEHTIAFEWIPEMKNDKDIQAMIKYFGLE